MLAHTLVIHGHTLVMHAHTLVMHAHVLVMHAHTLVMHAHTLVMHAQGLVMHTQALVMHAHTLVMDAHTLVMHFGDFLGGREIYCFVLFFSIDLLASKANPQLEVDGKLCIPAHARMRYISVYVCVWRTFITQRVESARKILRT